MFPVRSQLAQQLRDLIQAELSPRRTLLPPLIQGCTDLHARCTAAEGLFRAATHRLEELQAASTEIGAPFNGEMTIDRAWRHHQGAPAIFARFHLPACDGCAVRFDETLEEAASAYEMDLAALLDALNALLGFSEGAGGPIGANSVSRGAGSLPSPLVGTVSS